MSEAQAKVKADFVEAIGPWDDTWELILKVDPDFVAAYVGLQQVPWKKSHLSPKFKELCNISIYSAATYLHVPEILPHIKKALDLGATPHEIVEVLELNATLGIHAMNIGVPLLVEVLEERGRTEPEPLNEYQEELKAEFTKNRGYWHNFFNEMLELDPEMFAAYTEFSSVPWRTGTLTPAEKELIYISYDIASTHLYVPGTKLHIRNALNHGATPQQILEVMELASIIGIQSVTTAGPLLAKELKDRSIDL